jgi:phosphate transport system protein
MASQEGRLRYTGNLRTLEADAIRMGSLVLQMVVISTRIAIDDDDSLTAKVIEWEAEVDGVERDLVERVIVTLATESPVAGDLLLLTATLFLVNELEKIADEATKLASRVQKLHGEFPFEMKDLLQEMSKLAQGNLSDSLRLYSQYSDAAARAIIAKDDDVDRTFKTSRNLVLGMIQHDPQKTRQLLRCLEIFHALEHVSDRAADIARRLRNCYEPFVKV